MRNRKDPVDYGWRSSKRAGVVCVYVQQPSLARQSNIWQLEISFKQDHARGLVHRVSLAAIIVSPSANRSLSCRWRLV